MESSLSDGLNLFGLFGASRTTRARQGTSRAGPAGEEPARARVGQGMREEEPMESSLSDGLNLFGLFGASRTTRARQGTSRAGPAGEEPARARVGQGMQENEPALDKDFLLSHIKV